MENHRLVLPEHLNHHGTLFGGNLLKWVDEMAWLSASAQYPRCHFVTIAMDDVVFSKSVRLGSILRFHSEVEKVGATSVSYRVEVDVENDVIFTTVVTLVRVDTEGRKMPLPQE